MSIYTGQKRRIVTMNRDESRWREESGMRHVEGPRDLRMAYPVDGRRGGTWLGANDRGVMLCLLNRYQAARESPAPSQSRGLIIPQALEQGDFDRISSYLRNLDPRVFSPFDLFLMSAQTLMRFSWDGGDYDGEALAPGPWFLFTSSSFMADEVGAYRRRLFQTWREKTAGSPSAIADEILRGFHLAQTKGMESHSVLMEREKTHTKSIVQAEQSGQALSLRYFPEIIANPSASPIIASLAIAP